MRLFQGPISVSRSCWQNRPSEKLKRWVLRILSYLKATKALGLVFDRENFDDENVLQGLTDASFMGEESEV